MSAREIRFEGDEMIVDVRGLAPAQRKQFRTVINATLAGLISSEELRVMMQQCTPAEIGEEAARRLACRG